MPPKKGKKGKKAGAPAKDQISAVDRQFYELEITDLNNKLSRLRSHVYNLEEENEDLTEKMRQFEEDRTDVTAHLERSVAGKIDEIEILNEELSTLISIRENEKRESSDKLKNLEKKYKAMHEQLTSEIKLLNGKLNSLEEFRIQRDALLTKFDEQEADFKEQDRKHRELTNEMEQNAIVEKDQLKKEVETKLLQLSEDFTKSSEIRIAGYTRRLIRENIALSKEMDKMMLTQQKMETENKDIKKKARELNEKFATNEITKEKLVKTCQNQIEILDKLTNQYETLKSKYFNLFSSSKAQKDIASKEMFDKFAYNDMIRKMKLMARKVEIMKVEKKSSKSINKQKEIEISKLRDLLKNIELTVLSAIRSEDEKCNDSLFKETQRNSLLSQLISIIDSYSNEKIITPTISTISSIQLSEKTIEDMSLVKPDIGHIGSEELFTSLQQKQLGGKITPRAFQMPEETLFDVEIGSELVFSSENENFADVQPQDEEGPEDEGQAGSSSEEEVPQQPVQLPIASEVPQASVTKSESSVHSTLEEWTPAEESEFVDFGDDEDEENEDEINFFY